MYGVVVKRLPTRSTIRRNQRLTPTNNTLFYPNASGLSFNATTVSPNSIAPGNIRLFLNESDVSTNLVVGGNGTSRTVSLPALQPDTSYLARIVVSDQAGRSTTNAFKFDTFNAATAMAVEAEDYNYDSGKFNSPAAPNAYISWVGTREIDFHNNNNTGAATVFALAISLGRARQPMPHGSRSGDRGYRLPAYRIVPATGGITPAPLWMAAISCTFVARWCGQLFGLDRIGGDATTTNQTTSALGVFTFRPCAGYSYVPLTRNAAGDR